MTEGETAGARQAPGPGRAWPALLPYLRVALVAVAALVTAGMLSAAGGPASVQSAAAFSALYLLPVNILCLLLVRSLVHREGGTVRAMIGFERARFGRDILWGLLWIVVLYVPFALAIVGTMFALFGAAAFSNFATVFAPDPATLPSIGAVGSIVLGVVAFVTFAPLNAPTEELVYRGYSQGGLESGGPVLAILLPSVAFGLQHVFFAPSAAGMVVYGVAFLVWGVGAGLIYRIQKRLVPLIYCHLIVNVVTSLPALLVPFVAGS